MFFEFLKIILPPDPQQLSSSLVFKQQKTQTIPYDSKILVQTLSFQWAVSLIGQKFFVKRSSQLFL